MKTSLSVRIAEAPRDKTSLAVPAEQLMGAAVHAGFDALSVRASAVSVTSSVAEQRAFKNALSAHGLQASMITGNLALAQNNSAAPAMLRDIASHLDLAERLGARLVRVMLHGQEDVAWARRAADQAAERDITLTQQCHWGSLAETVDDAVQLAEQVGRRNFGITFEPANLLACGSDHGATALARLMPHLKNVYFQNVTLDPASTTSFATRSRGAVGVRFVPLFSEVGLDLLGLHASLREFGYAGWFTLHQPLLPEQSWDDALADAAAFVRRTVTRER